MDLTLQPEDRAFQERVRDWLEDALTGDWQHLRGRGGPSDEDALIDERKRWEQHLSAQGWTCLSWPRTMGGQALSLVQEVLFHEAYAAAQGPGRLSHIGETLLGPTLIDHGDATQQARFLPGIQQGTAYWCQGYSEPNAGSDLAGVQTRAEIQDGQWVLTGQKTWTSLAHVADWCFVLCRTEAGSRRHQGLSYLLVPMDQPGVTIRPIKQITGTSEFNEVFFDGAVTALAHCVGQPGDGWRIAMATLGYERGASTLGQQLNFFNELKDITERARRNGRFDDPLIRDRLAQSWMELRVMRLNAWRMIHHLQSGSSDRVAAISKLYWARWHRRMGELAMDVLGPASTQAHDDGELTRLQRVFLFSRADTIYAGSNEIQKTLIAERALGLPRSAR